MSNLEVSLLSLVEAVISAAESMEGERLETTCETLIEYLRRQNVSPEPRLANKVLGELRKWRHFGTMQKLSDALIRLGCNAHVVYRQYAQVLIERGELIPALELLLALVKRAKDDPREYSESCGLLGRVYKQIYVEAKGCRLGMAEIALLDSISYYRTIYDADPRSVWHGVNLVALLIRADRDGIAIPNALNHKRMAEAVVKHVEERWTDELPGWEYATAAEACLALEDWPGAERWLQKYLTAPDVDAFAIASTLRQFTEVWGLRVDGSPSGELIPVLRAALLSRKHGRLDLTPAQVHRMHGAKANAFERILGDGGLQTYQWMRQGIERARAIAKIRQPDGRGVGTGFLVCGRDLCDAFDDQPLLLTNAHVLSNDAAHRAAVSPDDAQISFEALAEPGRTAQWHRVREVVWNSGPEALDASLVRLDLMPKDLEPCPIANNQPPPNDNQRVYVIGHPLGGELSFSLQDNRLLDHECPPNGQPSRAARCLLHYRAPTQPGSSGSPVFDQTGWKVVGLHHAGGDFMPRLNGKIGTYAANEGIWIRSIQEGLASALG